MDAYSIFLVCFGLDSTNFAGYFRLNFWEMYLTFVARSVKAREPD